MSSHITASFETLCRACLQSVVSPVSSVEYVTSRFGWREAQLHELLKRHCITRKDLWKKNRILEIRGTQSLRGFVKETQRTYGVITMHCSHFLF